MKDSKVFKISFIDPLFPGCCETQFDMDCLVDSTLESIIDNYRHITQYSKNIRDCINPSELTECDIEFSFSSYSQKLLENSEKFWNEVAKGIGIECSFKKDRFYSPKEYNYRNDLIYLELTISSIEFSKLFELFYENEDIQNDVFMNIREEDKEELDIKEFSKNVVDYLCNPASKVNIALYIESIFLAAILDTDIDIKALYDDAMLSDLYLDWVFTDDYLKILEKRKQISIEQIIENIFGPEVDTDMYKTIHKAMLLASQYDDLKIFEKFGKTHLSYLNKKEKKEVAKIVRTYIK